MREDQNTKMIQVLLNILAVIAIAISGWTAREMVFLKTDFAALSARVPTSYPPDWFLKQYTDDKELNRKFQTEITKALETNRQLLWELSAERRQNGQ